MEAVVKYIRCSNAINIFFFVPIRENVVALDFLGHGDSPKPDRPDLYTADEVSIKSVEWDSCYLL